MKKRLSIIVSLFLLVAFSMQALAFASIPVKSIKLNASAISIKVGQTYTLKATLNPSNTTQKSHTFSTANAKVATVDKTGKIKGIKAGKTVVTVTSTANKKLLAKCNVTVINLKAVKPAATQQVQTANANGLPIVSKPLKLKVWVEQSPKTLDLVKNYDEIEAFKELEKRTGINIEWLHPATGQAQEQFNLMMASNEFPDMVWWNWRTIPGGPDKAIKDGFILKLNDQITQNAKNMTKIFEENPIAKKQAMTDSGSFYMFPAFVGSQLKGGIKEENFYLGPQFRKDWLDKLGAKVPTTIDEWYTILRAIKKTDLNGNGKADEIPFVSVRESGLKNFAAAWGILFDFYNDNGKVKYGPLEPAFKDYVTTMRKWYAEGLIDKDYATTDDKNFRAKIIDEMAGSYIGTLGGNYGTFTNLMKDKNPNFKLVGAPWPKGTAGKIYTAQTGVTDAVSIAGMAISPKNKNVTESVKLIDFMYSPKGIELMNFGPEGMAFTKNGSDIKYNDEILTKGIDTILGKYAIGGIWGFSTVQDPRCGKLHRIIPGQYELAAIFAASTDLSLPPITPSKEESYTFASIMSQVDTYALESFNKFIMGAEPLTKYDTFVETLRKMKIDEAIKLRQAAVERYNNRK